VDVGGAGRTALALLEARELVRRRGAEKGQDIAIVGRREGKGQDIPIVGCRGLACCVCGE
jgi:hypothetical protein